MEQENSDKVEIGEEKKPELAPPAILNLSKKTENVVDDKTSFADPSIPFPDDGGSLEDGIPMDLSKGKKAISRNRLHSAPVENGRISPPLSSLPRLSQIRRLKEELRNEETTLVLMKLIHRSQFLFRHHMKETSDRHNGVGIPGLSVQPVGNGQPPPLIRGGQSTQANHKSNNPSSEVLKIQPVQPAHRSHSQGMLPPLLGAPPSLASSVLTSTSISIGQSQAQQTTTSSNIFTSQPQLSFKPAATSSTVVAVESPAQRQMTAKLALRKQLEKTLLQIPPPKPPPPEMNFIPNASSGDFVALLGLEEAVKCILDGDARTRGEVVSDIKYVFNPFQCIQCATDFTPVWKRDKPGSKNVICEKCVTTNQKRALKQEHTNRLKSAFVKALQQEQEIDKSLFTSNAMSSALQHPPVSTTLHYSVSGHKNLSTASSSSHRIPPDVPTPPVLPIHSSLWSPQTLMSGIGNVTTPIGQQLMFPFPGLLPKSEAAQRQFLLDLVPRRSQIDGPPILWRS